MDSSPFDEKPNISDPFQTPCSSRQLTKFSPKTGTQTNLRVKPAWESLEPLGSKLVTRPSQPCVEVGAVQETDSVNELLRTELLSVRYELQTLREERQLELIRHEQEVRSLETKLEDSSKRIDKVEAEKRFLFDKEDELKATLKSSTETAKTRKQELERQIRRLKSENSEFKDLINDKQDELDSERRENRRRIDEYESRIQSELRLRGGLQNELQSVTKTLHDVQSKLGIKNMEVQDLETQLLRVKTQTGDLETLKVLQRELSEQVTHIKSLESTNRRQVSELKHLRECQNHLEVLQEEKRVLELKLRVIEDLRSELSRSQLKICVLQDEKNSWESYFRSENLEFDTPQALAKALLEERMERMSLLEKSGRSNPELIEKDQTIQELEKCLKALQKQTDQLNESLTKELKSRERLERQRKLALKEAQFLREQLKSFTMEETVNMEGIHDIQKTERIQELESLLDSYKREIEELKLASVVEHNESSCASQKRSAQGIDDERLGQLSRRNRQLQDDFEKLERSNALFCNEISALKFQLSAMESTSIRVLQLKDNPTSREQSVKLSILESLREENAALLAQIDGPTDRLGKMVPRSSLDNAKAEIKIMEKLVAEKEKRMTRLKEIWSTKSMELREAVYSLLGWKFDFMPNGRVKVTHMFAGREDQSIEFDGEKGTMKVSGGPDSIFHKEIKNNCSFWMARQSIPCLLASVLIEQYEKTTRAQM